MRRYEGSRDNEARPGEVTIVEFGIMENLQGKKLLLPGESQRLVSHSPDGFNWSYGGSGPAQLALALLLDAIKHEQPRLSRMEIQGKALLYYQDFKWAFVCGWGDTWEITSKDIVNWLWKEFGV